MWSIPLRQHALTCSFHNISADTGHETDGTNYSSDGVLAYEQNRHGKDGALLLDACFIPKLENINGQILLDTGCGAGSWSFYTVKHGVYQAKMIDRAVMGIITEVVEEQTHFLEGSVAELPYSDAFFDSTISLLIGCNLPNSIFLEHFYELNRILKKNGVATITVPASLYIMYFWIIINFLG